MSSQTLPHVVIVGAGFGGLRLARELAKAPVRVTLIDRNNYHLFQPLLYQVATAGIAPDQIAYPVRAILRKQRNVAFRMTEVQRVDLENQRLETTQGVLDYDYLALAMGGQTNFFGLNSVERNGFGLKGIEDATAIRHHLLSQFELAAQENDVEKRRARLTFVVVGGGPTGVECAGAISELIRLVLSKDYPNLNLSDVRVILLEAFDRLLTNMPPELSAATAEVLRHKQVEVRFGVTVSDFDGQQVYLKSGEVLPSHTVIWAAGVNAASLADSLGVEQGSLKRLRVETTLQLPAHPEVFVLGDAALVAGPDERPLPMIAPVAMQQASLTARNLMHLVKGEALESFVYHDPGLLATIGKNQAVARLGKLQFKGFLAWVIWLLVHLMQLVGFRNRLLVLINWAWDYLFYDRAVRLIQPERAHPRD